MLKVYEKKINCSKCKKLITQINLNRHENSCGSKNSSLKVPINYTGYCSICGKGYSKKGIATHIWRSHGEGKDHSPSKLGRKAWNKGLTKEDPRVAKSLVTKSKRSYPKKKKPNLTNEQRRNLSIRMSQNNPGGKSKWYSVNGIKVQGTWERDVAIQLTKLNILWRRCKYFEYCLDSKIKRYTPDFYLPDFNVYLEIKGHWWGKDREKMNIIQSTYPEVNFIILEKKEIDKLMLGELVW